uniref:Bm9333 n=1 Tax=Brugia malayi TaxID=6279 RepID=A0A0J9XRR4_BRUMA|nr:Bm9333 [Brugia malayi]
MEAHKQSVNTQSENDEIIDEMTNTSDSDELAMQEVSQLAIQQPLNGLNLYPVSFTDSQSASLITDNRNAANYEEISTNSPPPITISLYSDIQRSAAAIHGDPQALPLSVIPLTDYPENEYMPPPFRAPVLSVPTSNTTNNNSSEPMNSSLQQTITNIQTAAKGESMQTVKKGGRRRLNENACGNLANNTPETLAPKKRGRKRKDGSNDIIGGKTKDTLQKASRQSINASKLENSEMNIDKAPKRNSEISNQSLNAVAELENVNAEEKKKKRRPRKKIDEKSDETIDDTTNDTKKHGSITKKSSAAKKESMEELLCKQKSRMAFPKGTFLIRYCDLETLDCDQIWCVDNHHMLLKYRLSSHIEGKRRLYLKSQPERFIGWKCEEPWHFYELTILERDRDGSKVLVLYPEAKELAECREKARRQKQIAEEMKRGLGTSRNYGDIKEDFDVTEENLVKQTDIKDRLLHKEENMEVEMVDEAEKAVERFILIPDSEYTETNDEHSGEEFSIENPMEEEIIVTEDEEDE